MRIEIISFFFDVYGIFIMNCKERFMPYRVLIVLFALSYLKIVSMEVIINGRKLEFIPSINNAVEMIGNGNHCHYLVNKRIPWFNYLSTISMARVNS